MPRCSPSAFASVDLPAPIIPAMPMKMFPKTSGDAARVGPLPCAIGGAGSGGGSVAGISSRSGSTRGACQTAMTASLPSALEAHHPLDHALAGLGDLALLPRAVGAVGAQL